MLLPDHEIRDRSTERAVPLIEPFRADQLQPASYDLLLERQFCFAGPNNVPFAASVYKLAPGTMILGCTRERIQMPDDLAGEISGKSGNARHGLVVEAAGHVDPGYCGVITLELFNLGSDTIVLRVGMGIAKIVFYELTSSCERPYSADRNRHQYSHSPSTS